MADGAEDAHQMLRARLAVALVDVKRPRIIVTSPTGREGKTTTCVNLALSCARAGQRVMLIDLDLRHPDAHHLVGAHNDVGITDSLLDRRPIEECVQVLQPAGFGGASATITFVGSGPVAGNPAELLSRERTSMVLDLIGEQADIVLIDTPPVLSVADALLTGATVSGALLVVQAHRSTMPEVRQAKELLAASQIRLFGVVLNRFDPRDNRYLELPATPPEAGDGPDLVA